MRFHRTISIVSLVAFLPFAVGCSSQRTVRLDSDPGDASTSDASSQPTKISGYTTVDSEFHVWHGQMSAVGADSLEFTRAQPGPGGNSPRARDHPGDEIFRLAKSHVASVDVVDSQPVRTVVLVIGLFFLTMATAAIIDVAVNGYEM